MAGAGAQGGALASLYSLPRLEDCLLQGNWAQAGAASTAQGGALSVSYTLPGAALGRTPAEGRRSGEVGSLTRARGRVTRRATAQPGRRGSGETGVEPGHELRTLAHRGPRVTAANTECGKDPHRVTSCPGRPTSRRPAHRARIPLPDAAA